MASALIVYGSTTGNTSYVAEEAERILSGKGITVTLLDAANAKVEGLCASYDLILFGCSTWGDDSIELQDDFIPLFDDLDKTGVSGKNTAVFGCGDSSYTYFCGAVDAIEEKLAELGATVIKTLKIDGDPQGEKGKIKDWAEAVAASVL